MYREMNYSVANDKQPSNIASPNAMGIEYKSGRQRGGARRGEKEGREERGAKGRG